MSPESKITLSELVKFVEKCLRYDKIIRLPPLYWWQEGGVLLGNIIILYSFRVGRCSCLLHMQVVRRGIIAVA